MRNGTAWLLALWLLLCGTRVFADGPGATQHALWEVRGEHGSVFLVGSVHMLKGDHPELPAAFLDAYAHSTELWMEVDLDQATADALSPESQQLEMLPADTTLAATLGPQLYQQLVDRAKLLGVEPELLSHFQPWFAAMELESFTMLQQGYQADSGVDMIFALKARTDHRSVSGLETMAEQLSFFARLPLAQQCDYLRRTLEELDDSDSQLRDLVSAWEHGDSAALQAQARQFERESPALYRLLLVDRNHRWMDKLLPLLRSGHNCLVIVGTLHMVGPDGLVELFQRAGYKVDQH